MTGKGKRTRVRIEASDEQRLLRALERWADTGDFRALRTRAFVLLLWDGAIRTRAALALDAHEVVKDPSARSINVLRQIVQRPCEENRYRGRELQLSARTQDALHAYLRAARELGWLPPGLRGPLFVATVHQGDGQRLSARSAIHGWEVFQKQYAPECTREYELDDVVYSGRVAYLAAAGGNSDSLSEHSGISRRWAAEYRSEHKVSPADVMSKLDKRRR